MGALVILDNEVVRCQECGEATPLDRQVVCACGGVFDTECVTADAHLCFDCADREALTAFLLANDELATDQRSLS